MDEKNALLPCIYNLGLKSCEFAMSLKKKQLRNSITYLYKDTIKT